MPQHLAAFLVTVLSANKHLLLRTPYAYQGGSPIKPAIATTRSSPAMAPREAWWILSCRSRHWVHQKPLVEVVVGAQHATHPSQTTFSKKISKNTLTAQIKS
jgi:hypothetical protein